MMKNVPLESSIMINPIYVKCHRVRTAIFLKVISSSRKRLFFGSIFTSKSKKTLKFKKDSIM